MNENNITGIFNYCDRWCERCSFTDRCSSFERMPRLENQEPMDEKQVIEEVARNFAEALALLRKAAEEKGIDGEAFERDSKDIPIDKPKFTPSEKELKKLGHQYINQVRAWNKDNENLLKEKEFEINQHLQLGISGTLKAADILNNALEVCRYYTYFISAKIDRAMHGKHRDYDLDIGVDPIQNDMNGSAKISYIATERSINAWKIILANFPEQTNQLINILSTLQKIQKGINIHFPNKQQFIRPGFDEFF